MLTAPNETELIRAVVVPLRTFEYVARNSRYRYGRLTDGELRLMDSHDPQVTPSLDDRVSNFNPVMESLEKSTVTTSYVGVDIRVS